MIPIGSHGLDCLPEEDYGAVALYLQDQATTVDTALEADATSIASFYARPSVLAATTAVWGPNSSGGEQIFQSAGTWAISYSNMATTPVAVNAGIRINTPTSGWYAFGSYMNMVASGGVTAFSRRTLYTRATRQSTGVAVQLDQVVWRTLETNTGGEYLVADNGSFYALAGTIVDITQLFSHTNAASGINIAAGARIWCFYIGSGVTIASP